MKYANIILGTIALIVAGAGIYHGFNTEPNTRYAVSTISHGHGLVVDMADPAKVYIDCGVTWNKIM